MAGWILKAAVASFAAAGACADPTLDDAAFIQREAQTHDVAMDAAQGDAMDATLGQQMLRSFIDVMLQNPLAAIRALDTEAKDLEEATPANCTKADRDSMDAKFVLLVKNHVEKSPEAFIASLPPDCKALASGPSTEKLELCQKQFLGISQPCAECGTKFIQSITGMFGGCVEDCTPMAASCKLPEGSSTSISQLPKPCIDAASNCLKCAHPAAKKYVTCMRGDPPDYEVVKKVEGIFDDFAAGKMGLKATMEAIGKSMPMLGTQ